MKVIIDTDIALDMMANRQDFQDDAAKVFTICIGGLAQGYFTSNSVCDLHYVLHHIFHDEHQTRSVLETWLNLMKILEVSEEDCIKALGSQITDYEDAVIAQVARRNSCDYIVTRNLKDFENSPIPAVSPSQFIGLALRYTR
ncbi:MAG: PIN domain-containing protein [Spirochaetales bacterium]|nr:PIN domain-containing protein [Spirochaetales bacterium]